MPATLTKTQVKEAAQKELLCAMQVAFSGIEIDTTLWVEADKQMKRVERLFGYVAGSWNRGVQVNKITAITLSKLRENSKQCC